MIILEVCIIPLVVTPQHIFSDNFSQFILTSPVSSSKSFICCFLYKTSLKSLRWIGLNWRNNIANSLSNNSFCSVQREVSQPPWTLARMAPWSLRSKFRTCKSANYSSNRICKYVSRVVDTYIKRGQLLIIICLYEINREVEFFASSESLIENITVVFFI